MRLECPDCAAAYDVPESLVVPGREVRCVRCGHDWVPRGPSARLALKHDPDFDEDLDGERPAARPALTPERDWLAEINRLPVPQDAEDRISAAERAVLADRAPNTDLPLRTELLPVRPRVEEHLPVVVPPPPPPSPWPVLLAWIASVLAVGGGLAALWHWRLAVMAAWPPAGRLYGWIAAQLG